MVTDPPEDSALPDDVDVEETAPSGDAAAASTGQMTGAVVVTEPSPPDAEEYRSLLHAAAKVLDDVDRALAQLRDGTYGRCAECGAPLGAEALEADPTSQRCPAHHRDVAAD